MKINTVTLESTMTRDDLEDKPALTNVQRSGRSRIRLETPESVIFFEICHLPAVIEVLQEAFQEWGDNVKGKQDN